MEQTREAVATTRAERNALGRRLLAEGGMLWSALPIEWEHEKQSAGIRTGPQLPGFLWQVGATLGVLLRRPRASFAHVQEPVNHAAVLRLLNAVRLPLWAALIVALGVLRWTAPGEEATLLRPIHAVLDPRLAEILSLWLLLMVPIGVPLLYFALGIATHVAMTLTGGAPRSLAASMRATGYALAPTLLALAVLDVPLHLGWMSGTAYFVAILAIWAAYFVQAALALTGTHGIHGVRGFLVAAAPAILALLVHVGRALLVLPDVPGWEAAPAQTYWVP